jgi:hypothetical protein
MEYLNALKTVSLLQGYIAYSRYSKRNKVSQFQRMINRQESGNHGLFKVMYRQSLRNGL